MHVQIIDVIAVAVGYGFALVIGNWCLVFVMDKLWQKTGASRAVFREPSLAARLPQLVGLVERSLYVASFQVGKPEFIAVWLALKVAGQWKRWEDGGTADGVEISGRLVYNLFLIGSGLSVAFGAVGAQLIVYISDRNWPLATAVPSALILGVVILQLMARPYHGRTGLLPQQMVEEKRPGEPSQRER